MATYNKTFASNPSRLDEIARKMKARGFRLTPQRMAIVRILLSDEHHPTAEQVHAQVKVDFPMTSLATVYKTIALLKEMGEVQELPFAQDGCHYDGLQHQPHSHVVCIRCNEIMDSQPASLENLSQKIAQATGYQILSHRLAFFGICPKCQQNEPSKLS
jgi:Fur family peroxide stress response transcriptional regulator